MSLTWKFLASMLLPWERYTSGCWIERSELRKSWNLQKTLPVSESRHSPVFRIDLCVLWHYLVSHMLYGIILHCIKLHCLLSCCTVIYGVVWNCMLLHCIGWYCIVLYDIKWMLNLIVISSFKRDCIVLYGYMVNSLTQY